MLLRLGERKHSDLIGPFVLKPRPGIRRQVPEDPPKHWAVGWRAWREGVRLRFHGRVKPLSAPRQKTLRGGTGN